MVTVIVSIGADAEDLVTSDRVRNLKTALTALGRQILPRDQYRIVLVEQGARPVFGCADSSHGSAVRGRSDRSAEFCT
jgi:hypothetical protein